MIANKVQYMQFARYVLEWYCQQYVHTSSLHTMKDSCVLSMIYFNEDALRTHMTEGRQRQHATAIPREQAVLNLAQFIKTAIENDNLFVSSVCQSSLRVVAT